MTLAPVLLVEDNPNDEALILRALRKARLANPIDVVRDGADALDYLFAEGPHAGRDRTHLPTVVILDLELPKLNGLEVLDRIRADPHTRRLPVVILTSSDEDKNVVASYDLGANSFVQKPIDFPGFSEAIARVGVYWAMINRLPPTGRDRT